MIASVPSEAEFTAPHSECAEPDLWSAPDDASSEEEVTRFLGAVVDLLKPSLVVETGTFAGFTTLAIARALAANGRGHVYGIELDAAAAAGATARLRDEGVDQWATVVHASSLEWAPPGQIDLAFLDAGGGWHRAQEFEHLRTWMHPGTVVLAHDTARKNRLPRQAFEVLEAQGKLRPVWVHCPRGLMIAQPRWPSRARVALGMPRLVGSRAYFAVRSIGSRAKALTRGRTA
jgi:predicted O-methyltransferase YrrM